MAYAVCFGALTVAIDGCKPVDEGPLSSKFSAPNGAREGEDMNGSVDNETATVLGSHLPNPYTLGNMQQAYANMTGNNAPVSATDLYVRFRPTSIDQLRVLEEDYDLELFDEPLDYEIIQEGDYYQDPSIPDQEITWQYCVVPVGFSFPSGISHEVLAPIHIPTSLNVEQEAEYLAGLNEDGDGYAGGIASGFRPGAGTNIEECEPGYTYYRGQCIPDNQGPAPVPTIPQGRILVDDTQLGNQGVRRARVVTRRWFKVERMTTDDNGNYRSNKDFRKKVKLLVKFKNGDATVRGMRGIRVWQFLFPVRFKIGTFRGNELNSINHIFARNGNPQTRGARYWVAATVHNAVQHYKDLAAAQGTTNPPSNLKILISKFNDGLNGSAPMYHTRNMGGYVEAAIQRYVIGSPWYSAVPVSRVIELLERQVDITIGYRADNLPSDRIVETTFHELSHAATLIQAGPGWYNTFVDAETQEILGSFGGPSPYGSGTSPFSPIIALGESWANHYGRFLADVRYGGSSSCQIEQPDGPVFCGAGAHVNVLEGFTPDPDLTTDPFLWIPKGIFLDLVDDGVERFPDSGINDQVSGYSNQQLFSTIEGDIFSPQAYRDRLLNRFGNSQEPQIRNLFQQYGY